MPEKLKPGNLLANFDFALEYRHHLQAAVWKEPSHLTLSAMSSLHALIVVQVNVDNVLWHLKLCQNWEEASHHIRYHIVPHQPCAPPPLVGFGQHHAHPSIARRPCRVGLWTGPSPSRTSFLLCWHTRLVPVLGYFDFRCTKKNPVLDFSLFWFRPSPSPRLAPSAIFEHGLAL